MPRNRYAVGQVVRVRARHDAMCGREGRIMRIRPWSVGDEITVEFHFKTGEYVTLCYWDYEIEARPTKEPRRVCPMAITRVGQDYEVAVNGMLHTFRTKPAAQAYIRQYVREQKQRMKEEYLRQVYEEEAPCLMLEEEEESFGPGNPRNYGDST